jgi:hypothetical protein
LGSGTAAASPAAANGRPCGPLSAAARRPDRLPRPLAAAVRFATIGARGRFFDGPCAAWFRLRFPLVEGEAPSPYQRVAVAADSGNGISAALEMAFYSFVKRDPFKDCLRILHAHQWLARDAAATNECAGGPGSPSCLASVLRICCGAHAQLLRRRGLPDTRCHDRRYRDEPGLCPRPSRLTRQAVVASRPISDIRGAELVAPEQPVGSVRRPLK